MTKGSKSNIYFENLDGLRYLCFLSVFFFHSFYTESDELKSTDTYQLIKYGLFENGNLGVNFFFVLSGFLITYLLIVEKKITGQINLYKFWVRRALRIWPLFFVCVLFGFYVFPVIKSFFGKEPNETASIIYYLTFLNNFDFIKKGLPDASILGVLWSIAVEEQFYLVWPIILYFLPIKKYWIPFTLVIISSLIFRALNDVPILYEHHTLSCIGDMAVGAMGAWLIHQKPKFSHFIKEVKRPVIILIYFSFFFIFFFREYLQFVFVIHVMERIIISLVILFIILEQNFSKNSFFKLSKFKSISKLGVISYGLYCLHFFGILVTTTILTKLGLDKNLWEIIILQTICSLGLTIAFSKISYSVLEKPFLNLKNKFAIIKSSKDH